MPNGVKCQRAKTEAKIHVVVVVVAAAAVAVVVIYYYYYFIMMLRLTLQGHFTHL